MERMVKGEMFHECIQGESNLMIAIQAEIQQADSPGFERWAKIININEMAKTVLYLRENSLADLTK